MITFDSATPGTVTSVGTVTGAGQFFLNIDFRPATGLLYGLAVNTISGASNIYTINTSTAAATMVGSTPFILSLSIGSRVAMDFNPVSDQLRVVSRNGSNYQVSPITGTITATNTTLNYAPGDLGGSGIPDNVALAYNNNFAGATSTTLFGYSWNFDDVLRIGSVDGMPISPSAGTTFTIGGAQTLITVNLTRGGRLRSARSAGIRNWSRSRSRRFRSRARSRCSAWRPWVGPGLMLRRARAAALEPDQAETEQDKNHV